MGERPFHSLFEATRSGNTTDSCRTSGWSMASLGDGSGLVFESPRVMSPSSSLTPMGSGSLRHAVSMSSSVIQGDEEEEEQEGEEKENEEDVPLFVEPHSTAPNGVYATPRSAPLVASASPHQERTEDEGEHVYQTHPPAAMPSIEEAVASGCAGIAAKRAASLASAPHLSPVPVGRGGWKRSLLLATEFACCALAIICTVGFAALLAESTRHWFDPENVRNMAAIGVAVGYIACYILGARWSAKHGCDAATHSAAHEDDLYDLEFCIDGFIPFDKHGWEIRAPTGNPAIVRSILQRTELQPPLAPMSSSSSSSSSSSLSSSSSSAMGGKGMDLRLGKVVGLVGDYGVGKTCIMNGVYRTHHSSGALKHTRGVSLKWLPESQMILLDTNGGLMPVLVGDEHALSDRAATETFTQDLVLAMADYIIVVVNELTSNDQQYINALAIKLGASRRNNKNLFVIHNYRNATDFDEVQRLWEQRVELPYAHVGHTEYAETDDGARMSTDEADRFFVSTSYDVTIFHMRTACEGSEAGKRLNARTYWNLRNKIQALSTTHKFDPCTIFGNYARDMFPTYLKGQLNLCWEPVGSFAGDEVSGCDPEVVCRLVNRPTPAQQAASNKKKPTLSSSLSEGDALGLQPRQSLGLRTKINYGLGFSASILAQPDFDSPTDVIDDGVRMVVRVDVPGVKKVSLGVCTPPNDGTQYVEIKGIRDCDYFTGHAGAIERSPAPSGADDDDEPLLSRKRTDAGRDGDIGRHERSPPMSRSVIVSDCSDDEQEARTRTMRMMHLITPEYVAERTAQLIRPPPPPRRFGNLYLKVNMPAGSRLIREGIVIKDGVLSFVIERGLHTDDFEVSTAH